MKKHHDKTRKMKFVYVCSRYKGDVEQNISNMESYCKWVYKQGHMPVCAHLYVERALGLNENNREEILELARQLLSKCDELWAFGEEYSEGMLREIKYARDNDILVREIKNMDLKHEPETQALKTFQIPEKFTDEIKYIVKKHIRNPIKIFKCFLEAGFNYVKPRGTFVFKGKKFKLFHHWYNTTWRGSRKLEIPIARHYLNQYKGGKIIEVGNVLSHYQKVDYTIVDEYEKAKDVINEDAEFFKSNYKYDLILSISTFEHIGYDKETDKNDKTKILRVIKNLKGLLSEKGKIVFTVPLGGYNPGLDILLAESKIDLSDYRIYIQNKDLNWREVKCSIKEAMPKYHFPNVILIGEIKR